MTLLVKIEALTSDRALPYGWILGKPFPSGDDAVASGDAAAGFRREHLFNPGDGGEVDVLWVNYNEADRRVDRLEAHHVTEQAVVPLTRAVTQIVALSGADGAPDVSTIRAFRLRPGVGFCMRPAVWHATRGRAATCLMLTRRSTTEALVAHLKSDLPAGDTSFCDIPLVRLVQSRTPRA